MTFADRILEFYRQLKIETKLPKGVEVLNPYQDNDAFNLCTQFYKKYYSDPAPRVAILGINPGRYGGGITGIPFTDPVKLETICSIPNDLPKKAELSADFIYKMIAGFGGPEKFYSTFYFNSVSPLGFTLHGKNANYYDSPLLMKKLEPFIVRSLRQQLALGINRKVAYCLGNDKNYKHLQAFNKKENLFETITPLAHPRSIMQYKRRQIDFYVDDYLEKLKMVIA